MINMRARKSLAARGRVQVRYAFHLRCRHHSKEQATIQPVKADGRATVYRDAQRKHLRREPAVELKRHLGQLAALHSLKRHFLKLGIRSVDVTAVTLSD